MSQSQFYDVFCVDDTDVSTRYVKAMAWRYISDAITKEEALKMLKEKEAGKKEREAEVKKRGYPAYTTSVGWLGESAPLPFDSRKIYLD